MSWESQFVKHGCIFIYTDILYILLYLRGIMEVIFKRIVLSISHHQRKNSRKGIVALFVIGLCMFLIIPGCKTRPEACFGYVQVERPKDSPLLTGLPIRFTNCSIEGELFLWSFGDGTFSSEKDPVHTYDSAGIYEVILEVRNHNRTTEYTQWLNIQNPTLTDLLTGTWVASEFYEIRHYPNQMNDTLYFGFDTIKWVLQREGKIITEGYPDDGEYTWSTEGNQLFVESMGYEILSLNKSHLRLMYADSVPGGLPIQPITRNIYVSFRK
jgi:hypothetical protein